VSTIQIRVLCFHVPSFVTTIIFVLKQTTFMFVAMAPLQIPLNIKFQFMFPTITHVGANVELPSVEMSSMNVQIFKVPSSSTTLCLFMFEASCKSHLNFLLKLQNLFN
jgi:hypothetical protein